MGQHQTPEDYLTVKDSLQAAGVSIANAEVTMVPSTSVELDVEGADKIMRLIDALEDLDDIQNVYSNAEISSEVMLSLSE